MKYLVTILFLMFFTVSLVNASDYTKKASVRAFINKMHKKYHFNKANLMMLFRNVRGNKGRKGEAPTYKAQRSKKRRGSWDIYESYHLKANKVSRGVQFMYDYRSTLKRASDKYKVPAEIITAIIGIESHYGDYRGHYYVFDRLAYLAFSNRRRGRFYRYELQEFLRMTAREKVNPKAVMGSSSGAIGIGQFMPSNYKQIVIDFNGDGKHMMNSFVDAIGSIAHYFYKHGWQENAPIAVRVHYKGNRYRAKRTGYKYAYSRASLYGIRPIKKFDYHDKVHLIKLERARYDELWYGAKNFYVLTRYNHSSYYAMAVYQLSQKIKKAREQSF